MVNWSRVSKLVGMLGSPHDGERLNAARALQRQLDKEGSTFGDLATRVDSGGSVTPRVVVTERRAKPNPSAKIAEAILERARDKITHLERRFLRDIVRNAEMTGGDFDLTSRQANWLTLLEQQYPARGMRMHKPRKPPGPVPQAMLDECGLGDAQKDFDVGDFRSAFSGERVRKTQYDPRSAGQAKARQYKGDFGDDYFAWDDVPETGMRDGDEPPW